MRSTRSANDRPRGRRCAGRLDRTARRQRVPVDRARAARKGDRSTTAQRGTRGAPCSDGTPRHGRSRRGSLQRPAARCRRHTLGSYDASPGSAERSRARNTAPVATVTCTRPTFADTCAVAKALKPVLRHSQAPFVVAAVEYEATMFADVSKNRGAPASRWSAIPRGPTSARCTSAAGRFSIAPVSTESPMRWHDCMPLRTKDWWPAFRIESQVPTPKGELPSC